MARLSEFSCANSAICPLTLYALIGYRTMFPGYEFNGILRFGFGIGIDPSDYLDLMDPKNCSKIKPIKTGVIFKMGEASNEKEVEDAVCSAPGCYYDGKIKCL